MSAIELPVTFTAGPLHHDLLNSQFAAVKSALNELLSYIEELQDDINPISLSSYATVAQLNEHIGDSTPHDGMTAWVYGTAIVGSDYVSGNQIKISTGSITLAGSSGTVTYGTTYPNGILSIQATVSGNTGNSASFHTATLSSVDIHGTSGDTVHVTVIGW